MRFPLLTVFVVSTVGFFSIHSQAAPKKLLVVTVTTGFRHSSIPTGEKVLQQLAEQSGEFTIDLLQQPPNKPPDVHKPKPLKSDATPEQQAAFKAAMDKFPADQAAYKAASALWDPTLKQALEKLRPENLKDYDGVVFLSTTGDLPIPDKEGFLNWIKEGHAFIGMHAASDTFHKFPGYFEMLGGEFAKHGKQVSVDLINKDPKNPATANLPATWTIQQEEIYQFKNYDSSKVHELLVMNKHPETGAPGSFPVSWCKDYGKGKVFYTSLGHREDIWDTDPAIKDRMNTVEISKTYQAHILGGIEWALGLKPGDATPQATPGRSPEASLK